MRRRPSKCAAIRFEGGRKRDSEIVEEALRSFLLRGVVESIWAHQREQGLELNEDEALEVAYSELRAMREERDRSSAD